MGQNFKVQKGLGQEMRLAKEGKLVKNRKAETETDSVNSREKKSNPEIYPVPLEILPIPMP